MSANFDPPNLFGPIGQAYQQGAMAPYIGPMAQQQMQQGQQQLQAGQLNIEQLRMALAFNAWKNQKIQEAYNSTPSITPQNGSQSMGAQSTGGPSQGVVNGPQGAVGSRALTSTDSSMPSSSAGSGTPSPSGSYDGSISSGPWMPSVDPGQLPMDSIARQHLGMLAPEMLKGLTEGESSALNHAQIMAHLPGSPLTMLESFAQNPQAGQALLNNPQYLGQWPQIARQFGANPQDLSDINVRRVATLAANQARSGLKEAPLPMPEHFNQVGVGNLGTVNVNDITNQQTPGLPREFQTYNYERTSDPNDPEQTSAVGVPTKGLPGTGGPAGAPRVNLGFATPPTADQTRAAGLALSMRSGLQNMRQLESQGFNLTPSDRAAIVGVISENGEGPLGLITGNALSSLPLQEMLAHKLSPDGQTYLASLMPVLQGVGHHLGGARLNDVQIKALLESIAPVDTSNAPAMQQINKNRDAYFTGVLGEVGPARNMGPYKQTLGADWNRLSGQSLPDPYARFTASAHPAEIQSLLDKYKK